MQHNHKKTSCQLPNSLKGPAGPISGKPDVAKTFLVPMTLSSLRVEEPPISYANQTASYDNQTTEIPRSEPNSRRMWAKD